MKRLIPTFLTIAVAGAVGIDSYFLFVKNRFSGQTSVSTTSHSESSASDSHSSSQDTNSKSSTYQDGTYTGSATSTQWGDVQVQAVIQNHKITKINVLEYPDENSKDQAINGQALPTYKSEAISAQSAEIQLVTGASETYKGFTGSLQDALDQAKNTSETTTEAN